MATVRVVQDRMTVDLVVWRAFGRHDDLLVEQTLALNPGLAELGPVLPVGTEVILPEPQARVPARRDSVRLWS